MSEPVDFAALVREIAQTREPRLHEVADYLERIAPRTATYAHDCGCETCPDHTAALRLLPTGAAGEREQPLDEVVTRTYYVERELGVGDWSALPPALRATILRVGRAMHMIGALAEVQRSLTTPAWEPVAWTEWLTAKREYARLQAVIWKDAPEDVQGNPVEMIGYWRGYDAALGDVLARKVNR